MCAIIVLACLGLLVLGRGASAQRYPPGPIGPISTVPPDRSNTPTPPPFGADPVASAQPTARATPPFGSDPVDAPQSPGVKATIDTDGTSAVPSPDVRGAVVANPDNGNGAGSGLLPLTGLNLGVLVASGLLLILVGRRIAKTARNRQHRRNREHEERQLRLELPFVDTSAFVGRYSSVGADPPAS